MKERKSSKLTLVIVLAAVVAALTTLAVLVLRAKARRKALRAYHDDFDGEMDDCYCDDCCCDDVDEELQPEAAAEDGEPKQE